MKTKIEKSFGKLLLLSIVFIIAIANSFAKDSQSKAKTEAGVPDDSAIDSGPACNC